MKHIELFCGIGGNRVGLNGGETISAVDIDSDPLETYTSNFGENGVVHGSVEGFLPEQCDLVTAGPPCQPASQAGRKLGMADTRWKTSLDAMIRIVRDSGCRKFVFENVKTFPRFPEAVKIIVDHLKKEGFLFRAGTLIATGFGLAQKRERYFIVASKDGNPSFPLPNGKKSTLRDILEHDVENLYPDYDFYLTERRIKGLEAHKARHLAKGHGFGFSVLTEDDVAFTLVIGGMGLERNVVRDPDNQYLRFLTPRECARLQGFPDSYKIPKVKGRAYHQLAEAVPPVFIHEIAKVNGWI